MNSLSWMLYFAGISERISIVLIFYAILAGSIFAARFVLHKTEGHEPPPRLSILPIFAAAILAFLLPERKTIYMIAVVEASEAVVTTPDAREMLADVQTLIRRELDKAVSE